MVVNVRCLSCKYHFTFESKKTIPDTCPWCKTVWRKHVNESKNLLDVIYNALTHHSDKGFVYCDSQGWTSDESFGEEVRTNNGIRSNTNESPYSFF
jgi:hypothetical protein